MSKLLRSNFARLWKSRIFWLGMLFATGLSALLVIVRSEDIKRYS